MIPRGEEKRMVSYGSSLETCRTVLCDQTLLMAYVIVAPTPIALWCGYR